MNKHYSIFIRPISIVAHFIIINIILYFFDFYTDHSLVVFLNFAWFFIAFLSKLYVFNRTITVTQVVRQLMIQFSVFALSYFSYFSFSNIPLNLKTSIFFLVSVIIGITLFRVLYFTALRRYRLGGGNFRQVVLVGSNTSLKPIANFMMNRSDFGYKIIGFFSDQKNPELKYKPNQRALLNEESENIPFLGNFNDIEEFINNNKVDEIYCSLSETKELMLKQLITLSNKKVVNIKFVPDSNDFITKNLSLEYYGFVPVFSLRNFPLEQPFSRFIKRLFDVVFSIFFIVFILSWLTPILFVLIKIDSKGPLLFKQKREGLKGESFVCYKFRSMTINSRANIDQTTKNDLRVTKIGRFIRKTSIDEMPQFFNVLKGDMSVVGPRPHMPNQSEKFKKIVDNYMVRHFIKPGITGLAQVRGFRGEIESDEDIKQRINSDIFYLENWSFVMDINIILKTFLKTLNGDENAY